MREGQRNLEQRGSLTLMEMAIIGALILTFFITFYGDFGSALTAARERDRCMMSASQVDLADPGADPCEPLKQPSAPTGSTGNGGGAADGL